MRLAPGTRLGPYEVEVLLGAGGMAEVYRARDTRLGRDVALKVMSDALGASGPMLERFEREARLAGSLNHPNVVALHDVGLHDGSPYFITELLRGESLRERLVKGPIPLETALDWAVQMALGLAAAHERGIIHRDLKPENVFLTRDGHVKLLDFGIAKLAEVVQAQGSRDFMNETVSPAGASTGTGMVLGTPGYMSPEQVRADAIDARTDLFSFGCVLYEMLSGKRAFTKGSVVESGYATLHSDPEPLPPSVPMAVGQAVRRCLEKDPDRRFQSARDLAFHLELLRSPTGSSLPTPTPGSVPAPPSWRRRLWPFASVIGALALVAGTYWVVRTTLRPTMPTVEQITFRQGRVSAARFSPEGRVVFSAGWDGQALEVFARAPGSPDAQSSLLRDAELLSVSNKGELALLQGTKWYGAWRRGTLAIVPGAGGTPRELSENVGYADWSPSGELAVSHNTGATRQLEYPLGKVLFETPGYVINPRVSPNGKWVAFLHEAPTGKTELLVVDREAHVRTLSVAPATGASRPRNFSSQDGSGLAWVPSGEEVWFTTDNGNAIWASPLSGGVRLVYQGIYEMRLEDISSKGAVLVNARTSRRELLFLPPGQRERGLSWLAWTHLAALSDDGKEVLFSSSYGDETFTYLRATDGELPVRLGPGEPFALSPDGQWVLSLSNDSPDTLTLLPVGPGLPKTLSVEGVQVRRARWLQDGKRIVFLGLKPNESALHLYLVPIAGGVPTLISKTAIRPFYFEVSRDDRLVAARPLDNIVTLFPVDGGEPTRLTDLPKEFVPFGWDAQGALWLRSFRELPCRALRYDVQKHRVLEERVLSPADSTGLTVVSQAFVTPDGKTMAFDYVRILGYLYLLEGLAPGRP